MDKVDRTGAWLIGFVLGMLTSFAIGYLSYAPTPCVDAYPDCDCVKYVCKPDGDKKPAEVQK